jgi:nicotinamidase-related amidase
LVSPKRIAADVINKIASMGHTPFTYKIFTNKFSLFVKGQTEIPSLATTTAAARAATFAIIATQSDHVIHGFHLLSYRYLSIDRFKKIGDRMRLRSNLIG